VPPESDGSNGTAENAACPLHCRFRQGTAPADQVDWAGLPVNLDLAFSQNQRDNVYAQHLRLRRGILLRRWSRDVAQLCVCEIADFERLGPDADRSVSNR
jgi:hypothetical protein